ncbi:hypothetical protein GHT06_011487 [Daphnia sinensis]|uniref:Reverse transcriptase domain-containing protein n=1 Tax=Daphnia sinensis TaxID=1820382 RepID=A0AAD5LD78_9CRUS|nr:hypothetical protein GHT06_011487 [Daphnia sinensis]
MGGKRLSHISIKDRTLIRSELAQTLGLPEVGRINLKLQAVGHIHPEKERSVRRLRLRGTIPQAEDIELEAIEQPEIGKVAGSSKTEFVSELWSQGYQLADDRILSGKAGPCQIDIFIGAWTVLKKHLKSYQGELAENSKQILRQLYVDDYLSNASTVEEAMAVIGIVLKLFTDVKMDLRKWVTNSNELRRYLQKQGLTEDSAKSHSCLNLDS